MSSTVRIHRELTCPDRVLMIGTEKLGPLSEEITEFTIPPGEHVFSVKLGVYNSIATKFRVADGATLDLTVVENPEAVAPIVQGGWVKLVPTEPSRVRARLHELAAATRERNLIKAETKARADARAQAAQAERDAMSIDAVQPDESAVG